MAMAMNCRSVRGRGTRRLCRASRAGLPVAARPCMSLVRSAATHCAVHGFISSSSVVGLGCLPPVRRSSAGQTDRPAENKSGAAVALGVRLLYHLEVRSLTSVTPRCDRIPGNGDRRHKLECAPGLAMNRLHRRRALTPWAQLVLFAAGRLSAFPAAVGPALQPAV